MVNSTQQIEGMRFHAGYLSHLSRMPPHPPPLKWPGGRQTTSGELMELLLWRTFYLLSWPSSCPLVCVLNSHARRGLPSGLGIVLSICQWSCLTWTVRTHTSKWKEGSINSRNRRVIGIAPSNHWRLLTWAAHMPHNRFSRLGRDTEVWHIEGLCKSVSHLWQQ